MDPCVAIDQLERLLDEQLDDSQREALADHVERCPDCQQRLERLIVPRVAAAPPQTPESPPSDTGAGFLRGLKRRGPPGRDDDPISALEARPDPEAWNEPPAAPELLPTFRGFRIVREVGRGGMGAVYEAEQESLGRRVALKVLAAGSLPDAHRVRRFEREAKAAARLHHTNIVPVFGVGCQDGHHYFVMQFIVGSGMDAVLDDLRRLRRAKSEARPTTVPAPVAGRAAGPTAGEVARSLMTGRFAPDGPVPPRTTVTDAMVGEPTAAPPPLAPAADASSVVLLGTSELSASDSDRRYYRSVARIGIQVAEALEHAHRQGIVHRDVKPSNLLLDDCGNVWVADFGLAKTREADDLTRTGDLLGTLRYMAPERFSGHCDARSDLYSLGLTLYELLAMRPAYEAQDRHALIERVLHEEPERLKRRAPGVPRDLETIIAKATARDAAGRYATAAALAEDLRRFVEDRPIRARRVAVAERLARWCRRNKVLAASLGAAAVSLVLALVLTLIYAGRQARDNERIAGLASNLEKESGALKDERARLRAALAESNRRLAMRNLERGQVAFEKGQIGVGMLWTVESLRMAAEAGDPAWKRTALANLSAWRRQLPELKGILPHDQGISSVAFSPDGKTIVTSSKEKTARLWDAVTLQPIPIGQSIEHSKTVAFVVFGPDGRTLLMKTVDKTARFWDAATGRPIETPWPHLQSVTAAATGRPIGTPLPHPLSLMAVQISPDGRTSLLARRHRTVRLWDTATGRPIDGPIAHATPVDAAVYSPDGKVILTGGDDKTARLWDAANGGPIGLPMIHPDRVLAVAFSPDGQTILTGCLDSTARLWDTATGRPIGVPLRHLEEVTSVAFSPDGKFILTGSRDRTAQLWDAATGRRLGPRLEHPGNIFAVAFSPDGRSILTGGDDRTVRLWTIEPGQPVGRALSDGFPAFSPDGKTILVRDHSGKVMLWDIASDQPSGRPVKMGSGVVHAAWSPDGRTIVTGGLDRTARLWDATTGLTIAQPMAHPGTVTYVQFGPDGRTILASCVGQYPWTREARLWNTATGQPLGPPLPDPDPLSLSAWAFSPDGRTLLTSSIHEAARLWDVATGRALGTLQDHQGLVPRDAFSPDGRSIRTFGSDHKALRLWDAATGRPIGALLMPTGQLPLAFSPDGKFILTGSHNRTAQLWDVATGGPVGSPMAHPGQVYSVAFSPDGKTILTDCGDKLARLWDLDTGQPIGPPLRPSRPVTFMAFSPDGRFLLTNNYEGNRLRLWDAPAPLLDDVPRLTAWVETATGLELDARGSVRTLDRDAWQERRRRLEQLGGPPPDPAPCLDPILYSEEPAARGDAFAKRGLWDQAEAAYTEAARARPFDASLQANSAWAALTRFDIARGRPERAVAELGAAVSRWPDILELRFWHCLALLSAGDRVGWEQAVAGLLDRFPGPMHPAWGDNHLIAWVSAQGPYPLPDPEVPVRLAEEAIRNATEGDVDFRWNHSLNTLGAVLYRAGRSDQAIRQLQEGIYFARSERSFDKALLALAHHRLGHRDEARRCLERLRADQPGTDPTDFFYEQGVRLLRSEAEAVILYDPEFPDDPFAR
jgi:WD40 repeat protein/serine/threonine protein kinase/tetratricopeptide (TPR) repeat protein